MGPRPTPVRRVAVDVVAIACPEALDGQIGTASDTASRLRDDGPMSSTMLGSRSAVEWIIDRYQVKTDKPSGIVNDPNDWSRDASDPRYIIELLARIVTVSL